MKAANSQGMNWFATQLRIVIAIVIVLVTALGVIASIAVPMH